MLSSANSTKKVSFHMDSLTDATSITGSERQIERADSINLSLTPEKQIDELESQLKKSLDFDQKNEKNEENTKFELLRLKCKNGFFDEMSEHKGEKRARSCLKIREDMQKEMGPYAYKYCYIIFCGADNEHCWGITPDINNQEKYFKVSHKSYTYIVYEILRDVKFVQEELKTPEKIQEALKTPQPKQKQFDYMSSSHPVKKTEQRRSTYNEANKMNKSSQEQVKRRYSDVTSMQSSIVGLKKKSTKFNADKLPSKDQIESIAKMYTKFIGRVIPTIPFTCKEYSVAIQKAFKSVGIVPKLVIVKKEPQGDYFWDYECENEGTLHTWDLIKDRGVGVCL